MITIEYGSKDSSIVLIQPVDEHDIEVLEREVEEIRNLAAMDFRLVAVKISDWNKDLSPWPAPAVFGKDDFGSGAGETLREILSLCQDKSRAYFLGGYSLAALFSLWASYQTDLFSGIAAASPSMWFPGFLEYMKGHEPKSKHIYLSLGDKEEKTKNPVMTKVGEAIRSGCEILTARDINCTLEWNPGNHFKDSDIRTAKAFAWMMQNSMDKFEIFPS